MPEFGRLIRPWGPYAELVVGHEFCAIRRLRACPFPACPFPAGDGMSCLAAGKPAPDVSGIDFRGESLNPSHYRGTVVGLVFWDSWSDRCVREVPHLRTWNERLEDKPFALLGVNCTVDKQAAAIHPAVIVLDRNGIVRCKQAVGSQLDQAVNRLIENLERNWLRKSPLHDHTAPDRFSNHKGSRPFLTVLWGASRLVIPLLFHSSRVYNREFL